MATYQLFYVSGAAKNVDEAEIENILKVARAYNPSHQITGVLLFRSGIFLQLLEGDKAEVEKLYEKISKDPRHNNIIKMFGVEANERLFGEWSMGYRKIGDLDVKLVNEILSWNRLIAAAKELDNNLILYMLSRFKDRVK